MSNFYDEDAWMELRASAHEFMKNKEETVIKNWLNEIGYTDPVGYFRKSWKKEIEIYATHPGVLIGKAGINIEELKKMMSEEFYGEWEVKLVEVGGGFVRI